jgi:hypothetical protein
MKTPTHASSTRKATRPKLSVGQGKYGDTCLGEEKSCCTRHKDTRCTQHNLHIKYNIISTYQSQNTHKMKEYACK